MVDEYGQDGGNAIVAVDAQQVAMYDRIQIETQVATAKQYPRDVVACIDEAKALATSSIAVAEKMSYWLPPRKKKDGTLSDPITGPSIRALELIATAWGNVQYGAQVIEINRAEKYVKVHAVAFDMQKNVRADEEVTRRILFAGDDGLQLAIGSARSIGIRNTLKRILGPVVDDICVSAGEYLAKTSKVDDAKKQMFKYFDSIGIPKADLLRVVDCDNEAQLGANHITKLRGLANAIKEGWVTVESVLGKQEVTPETETGTIDIGGMTSGVATHGKEKNSDILPDETPQSDPFQPPSDDFPEQLPADSRSAEQVQAADAVLAFVKENEVDQDTFNRCLVDNIPDGYTGRWEDLPITRLKNLRSALAREVNKAKK